MNIILKPFGLLLGWLYAVTGSYGLAIIIFGLIFKIVLFPLTIRGRKGMLDVTRLSERQKEIQAKYGRDRQKASEELQNLYTTEGVKPSSGCLWSFASLPVLMILYFILSQPFTYLMELTGDQVKALSNFILGAEASSRGQLTIAQDVFLRFDEVRAALPEIAGQITAMGGPINFDFFGINLSAIPKLMFWQDGITWAGLGLFLVPILSAVFALLSMLTNTKLNQHILGKKTPQDQQNRTMMFFQPVISLWLGFTLPAALGLYWASNGLFGILQEFASVGTLKKYIVKKRAEAEERAITMKAKEQEKRRQAADLKKQKVEEQKRIKLERKVSTEGITDSSRVGARAYARGRTHDPERHATTAYRDPDDIIKEQRAAAKQAKEAANAGKPAKGRKKKKGEQEPAGMILNGEGTREVLPEAEYDGEVVEVSAEDTAIAPHSDERED